MADQSKGAEVQEVAAAVQAQLGRLHAATAAIQNQLVDLDARLPQADPGETKSIHQAMRYLQEARGHALSGIYYKQETGQPSHEQWNAARLQNIARLVASAGGHVLLRSPLAAFAEQPEVVDSRVSQPESSLDRAASTAASLGRDSSPSPSAPVPQITSPSVAATSHDPSPPPASSGGGSGSGIVPPVATASPPPPDDNRRSWIENYRASRAANVGIFGSAVQATKQRARQWAQPIAEQQTPLQSALDNAQQIDRWNVAPGQHVLQAAAGRALEQDQSARQQAADEAQRIMDRTPDAPKVSDQARQQIAASKDPAAEWYARSRLGYRPGDPQARDPAKRRDQSDRAAQWEDVLPGYDPKAPSQEHQSAIEAWRQTREQMDSPDFRPADDRQRELHAAYQRTKQRGRAPGAADLAMWNQRLDAGAPATAEEWASQFPQAEAIDRRRSTGDRGDSQDATRTYGGIAGLEYARYAASRLGQAAAQGSRPLVGDAVSAVASDAMGMASQVGTGVTGIAAGAATGNPAMVAKGMADVAEVLVGFPAKLEDWADALVESKDSIKMFSADLANASAMAELRTMQRGFRSAQATGAATAGLSAASQGLKDELQPIKDTAHNWLARDLTKGLQHLTELVRMGRELLQYYGILDSEDEMAGKQTPFQELIAGLSAGGFKTADGREVDLQNGYNKFGTPGMGGVTPGSKPGGDVVGQQTDGPGVQGRTKGQPATLADMERSWVGQDFREQEQHDQAMAKLDQEAEAAQASGDTNRREEIDKQRNAIRENFNRHKVTREAARNKARTRMAGAAATDGQAAAKKQQDIQGRDRGQLPDSPAPRLPIIGKQPRDPLPTVHGMPKGEAEDGPSKTVAGAMALGGFVTPASGVAGVAYTLWAMLRDSKDKVDAPPPSQRTPNF